MEIKYTEEDKVRAMEILKLYQHWNTGQKSIGHAFGGAPNEEDSIYDERRKLIKKSYEVLNAP